MQSEYAVTASVMIPAGRFHDLLVTAVEGGSGYWVRDLKITHPTTGDELDYDDPKLFTDFHNWRITVTDVEDGETVESTREKFIEGMSKMSPRHVEEIMTESFDAETADAWFQIGMLGEITYG